MTNLKGVLHRVFYIVMRGRGAEGLATSWLLLVLVLRGVSVVAFGVVVVLVEVDDGVALSVDATALSALAGVVVTNSAEPGPVDPSAWEAAPLASPWA